MLCRNNDYRAQDAGGPAPWDKLLTAHSQDAGVSWSTLRAVPVDSVVSRMHILPLSPAAPGHAAGPEHSAPGARRRYVMTDNDWWSGGMVHDRLNAALYFALGDGTTFSPAVGYSRPGEVAGYPQMALDTRTSPPALLISYSSGNMPRSIRVVRVDPMPAAGQRYVYPRGDIPQARRPSRGPGPYLSFGGGQSVATRAVVGLSGMSASFGAWVRVEGQASFAVLADNRNGSGGGGVFGLNKLAPFVYLPCAVHNVGAPSLRARMYGWSYIGVSVAVVGGRANVTFVVDGESECRSGGVVDPSWPGWLGSTASLGYKRQASSGLPGISGDVRFVGAWSGLTLSAAQHNFAANLFAASVGRPNVYPADASVGVGPANTAVWMDTANTTELEANFVFPPPSSDYAGVVADPGGGSKLLRVCGLGSASVELPSLRACPGGTARLQAGVRMTSPSASGRVTSPDEVAREAAGLPVLHETVVLYVGDGKSGARLVASSSGSLAWRSNTTHGEVPVCPAGCFALGAWIHVNVTVNSTHAGAWASGCTSGGTVSHGATSADVWTFVGQGWYNATTWSAEHEVAACVEVDVATVTSSC